MRSQDVITKEWKVRYSIKQKKRDKYCECQWSPTKQRHKLSDQQREKCFAESKSPNDWMHFLLPFLGPYYIFGALASISCSKKLFLVFIVMPCRRLFLVISCKWERKRGLHSSIHSNKNESNSRPGIGDGESPWRGTVTQISAKSLISTISGLTKAARSRHAIPSY